MRYWRSAAWNAWTETVSKLRLNSLSGLMLWVAGTLVVLGAFFFMGYLEAFKNQLLTRILLAAVPLGAVPFVFAWKLLGQPPKMYRSLRDWTRELEEAIIEAHETDKAMYGIAERYQNGLRTLGECGDLAAWEVNFDSYIQEYFDASLFLQLCAPAPPERGYTTIQRGDGSPMEILKHPPPSETDRIETKLHKISSFMPYAAMNYRGRTINSLSFKHDLIRQYGLPEHRLAQDAE